MESLGTEVVDIEDIEDLATSFHGKSSTFDL